MICDGSKRGEPVQRLAVGGGDPAREHPAVVAQDAVVAVAAGDPVGAVAADDRVVLAVAEEDVVADLAVDEVVAVVAVDLVGARRCRSRAAGLYEAPPGV